MLSENKKKFVVVLSFIFLFGFVYRNLWSYGMLAYGDATPFPNNYSQAFKYFFQSFDPRSPGITMPQASVLLSTLVPLEALLAFIFGGNFVWAQKVFHFLPIPLAFVTMYFFVSKFTPSRPARFLTALIYCSNHFMVAEFAGGFEGNLYIPALFPLLIYLLYRIYINLSAGTTIRKILIIYSSILTFAYVLSDHVLILLSPFLLAFIIAPVFSKNAQKGRFILKNSLVIFLSFFIAFSLSAYHAYSYFKIALPFLSSYSLPADLIPFFEKNVRDTYWQMGLPNILRLGGAYFMNFYSGSNLWARAGFVLPLLTFSWFLFPENRKGRNYKIGLLFTICSLLIILLIYLTALGMTITLFSAVPALYRFRNPSRLSLFLAFLFSPLIALSLNGFLARFKKFAQERNLIFTTVFTIGSLFTLAALIFYYKGFFSGDFTMHKNRGDSFWIKDRQYKLSQYLSGAQETGGPFRVAHFPWNHESAEIKLFWLDPYSLGVPIEYGAYIQNDYLEYLKSVYSKVSENDMPGFGDILAKGAVKYIVLDSQSKEFGRAQYSFAYHVPWLDGSYDDLSRIIGGSSDVKQVADVEGYKIYENRKFNKNAIDGRKAGFYMDNRSTEDRIRLGLIIYTVFSWAVIIGIYFKPRFVFRTKPVIR